MFFFYVFIFLCCGGADLFVLEMFLWTSPLRLVACSLVLLVRLGFFSCCCTCLRPHPIELFFQVGRICRSKDPQSSEMFLETSLLSVLARPWCSLVRWRFCLCLCLLARARAHEIVWFLQIVAIFIRLNPRRCFWKHLFFRFWLVLGVPWYVGGFPFACACWLVQGLINSFDFFRLWPIFISILRDVFANISSSAWDFSWFFPGALSIWYSLLWCLLFFCAFVRCDFIFLLVFVVVVVALTIILWVHSFLLFVFVVFGGFSSIFMIVSHWLCHILLFILRSYAEPLVDLVLVLLAYTQILPEFLLPSHTFKTQQSKFKGVVYVIFPPMLSPLSTM